MKISEFLKGGEEKSDLCYFVQNLRGRILTNGGDVTSIVSQHRI